MLANQLIYTDLDGYDYQLPAGASTDGASSRLFNGHINLLPTNAQNSAPSWLHDWHYRKGKVYRNNQPFEDITRKEADLLLREGLILSNVGETTARRAYLGVRLFGWMAWNKYRKHRR